MTPEFFATHSRFKDVDEFFRPPISDASTLRFEVGRSATVG